MRASIGTIFSTLFDFVAPARRSLSLVRGLILESLINCANPDGSLPYHNKRVRALVWEIKYRANARAAALAGEYISDLLLAEMHDEIGKPLLIPVPMHKERRRERGHNQTELLCEAALPFVKDACEYVPTILERTRATLPQQGLTKHKRLQNIKKSMQVKDPTRVRDRVCIVVDDVMTTGATFTEAKRVLLQAGARCVRCVALAVS